MYFIEDIRVGEKCTETGFRAEQNRPPSMGSARVILRVRVAEDTATQGNEVFVLFMLERKFRHVRGGRAGYYPALQPDHFAG